MVLSFQSLKQEQTNIMPPPKPKTKEDDSGKQDCQKLLFIHGAIQKNFTNVKKHFGGDISLSHLLN